MESCCLLSLNCGHQRAYCSAPRWYMSMESHGGMISAGENWRTLRKTCPNATLSITNPTWIDPSANPGLRDENMPRALTFSSSTSGLQCVCVCVCVWASYDCQKTSSNLVFFVVVMRCILFAVGTEFLNITSYWKGLKKDCAAWNLLVRRIVACQYTKEARKCTNGVTSLICLSEFDLWPYRIKLVSRVVWVG
jgi:hypothetical protein